MYVGDLKLPGMHYVAFVRSPYAHERIGEIDTAAAVSLAGVVAVVTGEAATIGSTPANVNAMMDALKPRGVRHLDMPLTPENVWQAIHTNGSAAN